MRRVLVVDDDPGVREVIAEHLRIAGMEADTAVNGRIALEKLCCASVQGPKFDLMILDIMMPEVDGWQVLKAVKNNPLWSSLKIVVMSGHAESAEDLRRIIEFDGVYVEKRADFMDTVVTIVERIIAE